MPGAGGRSAWKPPAAARRRARRSRQARRGAAGPSVRRRTSPARSARAGWGRPAPPGGPSRGDRARRESPRRSPSRDRRTAWCPAPCRAAPRAPRPPRAFPPVLPLGIPAWRTGRPPGRAGAPPARTVCPDAAEPAVRREWRTAARSRARWDRARAPRGPAPPRAPGPAAEEARRGLGGVEAPDPHTELSPGSRPCGSALPGISVHPVDSARPEGSADPEGPAAPEGAAHSVGSPAAVGGCRHVGGSFEGGTGQAAGSGAAGSGSCSPGTAASSEVPGGSSEPDSSWSERLSRGTRRGSGWFGSTGVVTSLLPTLGHAGYLTLPCRPPAKQADTAKHR